MIIHIAIGKASILTIRKIFTCLIFCIAFLGLPYKALPAAETLKAVSPLSKHYGDVMRLVLSNAGVDVEYVEVPNRRGRRLFIAGEMHIECCIVPLWREWPEEQDVQLYSDSFYTEYTLLVGAANSTIDVSNLGELRIAMIDGFGYAQMDQFGSIVGVSNFEDLSRLLLRGRAHAAVIGEPEFLAQNRLTGGKLKPLRRMESYDLKFRINAKWPHLVPKINDAIARLKKCSGIIDVLEHFVDVNDVLARPECMVVSDQ